MKMNMIKNLNESQNIEYKKNSMTEFLKPCLHLLIPMEGLFL